jgi:hypothetical protein
MQKELIPEVIGYLQDHEGITEEEAVDTTMKVIGAMKFLRKAKLSEYINKRVEVNAGDLIVEAFVIDVKCTDEGTAFQVRPVAGSKTMWVKQFIRIL